MKDIGENTAEAIFYSVIAICVTVLVCYLVNRGYQKEYEAIKAGLVEKQKAGAQGLYWSLPE